MNQYDLIAEQDKQRTVRSFIGVLAGAFGADQSYGTEDGYSASNPGGYQAIGVNGAWGLQGQPISNLQTGAVVLSPGFLMLAGLAAVVFLAMKK